jgi:hypothetical protein
MAGSEAATGLLLEGGGGQPDTIRDAGSTTGTDLDVDAGLSLS